MLFLNQIVRVRNPDLRREAWIDRASARTSAIQIRTRIVRINNILRLNPEALEERVKQRRIRINVQHTRNSEPMRAPTLHLRDAFLHGPLLETPRRNLR